MRYHIGVIFVEGVIIFFDHLIVELAILATVTASYIVSGFCPHMGAGGAVPFTHPSHPPHRGLCRSLQSGKRGSPRQHPANSNRSYYQHNQGV
ncbi:MAG: hypothetical protein IJZ38_09610 [Bacteroides sp.]|nr:hypothetical protein [Bacteroides sp.]